METLIYRLVLRLRSRCLLVNKRLLWIILIVASLFMALKLNKEEVSPDSLHINDEKDQCSDKGLNKVGLEILWQKIVPAKAKRN